MGLSLSLFLQNHYYQLGCRVPLLMFVTACIQPPNNVFSWRLKTWIVSMNMSEYGVIPHIKAIIAVPRFSTLRGYSPHPFRSRFYPGQDWMETSGVLSESPL